MKLTIILSFISIAIHAGEPSRTWTDSTGRFTRVGTFETIRDGAVVIHQTETNTALNLPLDKLSMADLVYLLSRPSVVAGTLSNLSGKYGMSSGGVPIERGNRRQVIEGRISGEVSSNIYRIKTRKGPIAIMMTPPEAASAKKRQEWHVVEVFARTVVGPKDAELRVYQLSDPPKEKDLLILLASYRNVLLPHIEAADSPPQVLAAPTAGNTHHQEKLFKKSPEQIEPPSIATPNAPAGTHFLDAVHGKARNLSPAQKDQQTKIRNQVDALNERKKKIEQEISQLYEAKLPKQRLPPADLAKADKLKAKKQMLEQEIREHRVKYQLIGK